MAMPTAAQQSLAALKQGPVQVMIDPDDTAVELFVKDGIDLSFVAGQEEASVDLVGVYDLFTSGDAAEFEMACPESSLNLVNVLFPEGLDGTTYRGFGRAAGLSMRDYAKAVRIRPWQTRDAATLQVELWVCVPSGDAGWKISPTDPFTFTRTFRALPDLTQSDGMLIGKLTFPARS